jgi:lipopolysaccharide/colanic/teichoic acid biosynthesis glycosyltransferase
MQLNTVQTAAARDQFLISSPVVPVKNDLSFVYIGKNFRLVDLFDTSFLRGIAAESYSEVKTAITSALTTGLTPDVIIIDTLFDEQELKNFNLFLQTNNLSNIPVLYNSQQLVSKSVAVKYADLIDDVVDLTNGQIDFASKVRFLKRSKEEANKAVGSKPIELNYSYSWEKRLLDIVVSALLLVLLSPIFLLIAAIIKLESKGPVFYNAKRAGRGFKIFSFHKFRTMEVNADKKIEALAHLNQYNSNTKGPKFFKLSNDPRVTRFGKFLRNSSLDELPQLFNVLKGDMSLVGNRPLPLYEAATLTTDEFVERFTAPAGITGLWQIKKRGRAEMSVEERISLDISYARNSNMLYDFWIMANTPKALIQKSNV